MATGAGLITVQSIFAAMPMFYDLMLRALLLGLALLVPFSSASRSSSSAEEHALEDVCTRIAIGIVELELSMQELRSLALHKSGLCDAHIALRVRQLVPPRSAAGGGVSTYGAGARLAGVASPLVAPSRAIAENWRPVIVYCFSEATIQQAKIVRTTQIANMTNVLSRADTAARARAARRLSASEMRLIGGLPERMGSKGWDRLGPAFLRMRGRLRQAEALIRKSVYIRACGAFAAVTLQSFTEAALIANVTSSDDDGLRRVIEDMKSLERRLKMEQARMDSSIQDLRADIRACVRVR